jgi:protein-tyrosine-phosphatase
MENNKKSLLLFVCTGNVCRSPMAEYLMRHKLGKTSSWQVASAGLFAASGQPPSVLAVQAMDDIGIDIRAHRSMQISDELLKKSTMIVVMTSAHLLELAARFPAVQDRTYVLGSFLPEPATDIPDPIGGTIQTYRQTRELIALSLNNLEKYIANCHSQDIYR